MKQKKFSIFIFSFLLASVFPTSVYGDQIHQTNNGNGNCSIVVNGNGNYVTIEKDVCGENANEALTPENTLNIKRSNSLDIYPSGTGKGYAPIQNFSPPIEMLDSESGYAPIQNFSPPIEMLDSEDGYAPIQNPPPQI